METPKVTEKINDEGAAEVTAETVDYRLPAGRDENPDKEKVEITHVTEEVEQRATCTVAANAAAEVGKKLQASMETPSTHVTEEVEQRATCTVAANAAAEVGKKLQASMETPKDTERVNDEGAAEVTVETVDYRLPAGRDENPDKEKVEITHVTEEAEQRATGTVVSNAVAEVGKKLQEAKEAVFPATAGKGDTEAK